MSWGSPAKAGGALERLTWKVEAAHRLLVRRRKQKSGPGSRSTALMEAMTEVLVAWDSAWGNTSNVCLFVCLFVTVAMASVTI